MTTSKIHLCTVVEYHQMIDCGILTPESHVELLEGCIVEMNPQRAPHAATTQRTSDYLKSQLTQEAHIRMQLPVTLSNSEPEPDIAVVHIDAKAYGDRGAWHQPYRHPSAEEIFFLIEIYDTTLRIDRQEKALIYARANIPEYWVLDVVQRQAYIYRYPTSGGYQSETVLLDSEVIHPLNFPSVSLSFIEMFLPYSGFHLGRPQ
ncbi:MAG: Uma2 family endonuclease [Okeania sp. SIO3B5]|uniref:Uma2 family endonuclease n=1 Tax=Okeania sp. SIO3B5 TaxID=2607811 RepID=UPI001401A953|nr:Uma2 family endonuclease [Okeania sp. SIO3B5]NEO55098.1 Uma2 family endonuclease [Okeania sp. SIO3B5]